jgi:ribosomal protein S18 acetylase RimI-like enzyme
VVIQELLSAKVFVLKINLLANKTNLIFGHFEGQVFNHEDYQIVQTKSNPSYHWGNYIIFKKAPVAGDMAKWMQLFDDSFQYYMEPHHYCFTWDVEDKGEVEEFIENGYALGINQLLAARELEKPNKVNKKIKVRKLKSDQDWEDVIDLQVLCADPKYLDETYYDFKRNQMINYRKMSEEGLGSWYGAFLDGEMVGDLGIYTVEDIARYQNVGTHPEYRKQGICSTLVYKAAELAAKEYGVSKFTIVADADSVAATIYKNLDLSILKLHIA